MTPVLLVGIGNTLRRDDGVGHEVVKAFEFHPKCRIILIQQLLPELVVELVRYSRVVFVDATIDIGEVKLCEANESSRVNSLGHVGDAGWLLGLCRQVNQDAPRGFFLSIPVDDFGFGEGIGDLAKRNILLAISELKSWLAIDEVCTL